jgi:hypothetical protein
MPIPVLYLAYQKHYYFLVDFLRCLTRQLLLPLGPSSRPPHANISRCTLTQPLPIRNFQPSIPQVTANHLGTTHGPAIDVLDHDHIIQLDP